MRMKASELLRKWDPILMFDETWYAPCQLPLWQGFMAKLTVDAGWRSIKVVSNTHRHTRMHVCARVCVRVCVYVYTLAHVCVYNVHACMCVCVCVCNTHRPSQACVCERENIPSGVLTRCNGGRTGSDVWLSCYNTQCTMMHTHT